jgi:hypothetical protein
MTSQSPRIYLYKITFEEVPYYYYGVHKEKRYNEYYMGTPVTHKWVWDFYTPKKQILEVFDYNDEEYIKAQEVEKRLIKPVLNDKWCLNENVGGVFSLEIRRKNGEKYKKLSIGVCGRTKKKMTEDGKKGGSISGENHKKNKTGVCGRTKQKMTEDGKKGGKIAGRNNYENKIGVHGRSIEEMSLHGKMGGKISSSQKWMCLETGFISNPGSLTTYQRKSGIDPSKRIRIYD